MEREFYRGKISLREKQRRLQPPLPVKRRDYWIGSIFAVTAAFFGSRSSSTPSLYFACAGGFVHVLRQAEGAYIVFLHIDAELRLRLVLEVHRAYEKALEEIVEGLVKRVAVAGQTCHVCLLLRLEIVSGVRRPCPLYVRGRCLFKAFPRTGEHHVRVPAMTESRRQGGRLSFCFIDVSMNFRIFLSA
ncbi:MAG: hypothetical protein AABM64_00215 [Pseudomonadota bacterium]